MVSFKEEEESRVVPSVAVVEEPTVVEDVVKAALVTGEESEQRIAPLIRNRKVRMLTILNFFLTLIALLLFFTVILLFAVVVVMKQQVALSTPKDMPCLFEWGEWSSCSSTCRISQEDATPSMRRRVTRVYHASGKYARCPEGLKVGFEQIAPCNTQL
ncbi:hypothetical protein Tcan_08116 [Toxocara canis]|uniref:Uncharacterized protein n=1 Tax=Toxocara canis TaxID=6265 RepID=A0A0B2UZE4_TOXCA|nr:hypothetical protein Tcan_18982 [Toxocara canis]KHN76867.1 hypothetical protein Tcan_08116 [Toxocara canis]